MRQAMGVAVFSGMLGVTFFGLLLTPVFYVVMRRFGSRRSRPGDEDPAPPRLAHAHVRAIEDEELSHA